jgi:hypothetical protein
MRVTIQHRQEDGLLPNKKLYFVDCTVLFSEEEKAIIGARGLGQHYIVTDSETPPPSASQQTLASLLKVLAPCVFLGGCVAGLGMTAGGNGHGGDFVTGTSWFAALAMFLGSIALRRHVRVAAQPKQTITLGRLLVNPSFSAYAFDNARAKVLDQELRETLARLKEGLLVNRDIQQAETFEL